MKKFIESFAGPIVLIGRGIVGVFGALCQGVSDLFGWSAKLLNKLDDKMESLTETKTEMETQTIN